MECNEKVSFQPIKPLVIKLNSRSAGIWGSKADEIDGCYFWKYKLKFFSIHECNFEGKNFRLKFYSWNFSIRRSWLSIEYRFLQLYKVLVFPWLQIFEKTNFSFQIETQCIFQPMPSFAKMRRIYQRLLAVGSLIVTLKLFNTFNYNISIKYRKDYTQGIQGHIPFILLDKLLCLCQIYGSKNFSHKVHHQRALETFKTSFLGQDQQGWPG